MATTLLNPGGAFGLAIPVAAPGHQVPSIQEGQTESLAGSDGDNVAQAGRSGGFPISVVTPTND